MTIILTLGNPDQIVQVSDRRLSSNGRLVDDESNKVGSLVCSNARLAFGFSGLATYGTFNASRWLVEKWTQVGTPDFDVRSMLKRLTEKATDDFRSFSPLAQAPKKDKRLSVIFSGYHYAISPPLCILAIMSNFQDFDRSSEDIAAWEAFKCSFWKEKRPPLNEALTLVKCIGAWQAVTPQDVAALRDLLRQRKPAKVIVDKAVDTIRKIADRSQAAGTIGKQLSSIILPRDISIAPTTDYHSTYRKTIIHLPSMAVATERAKVAVADLELSVDDGIPIVYPKVGRNQPCLCGSGKKYKFCHGRSSR